MSSLRAIHAEFIAKAQTFYLQNYETNSAMH